MPPAGGELAIGIVRYADRAEMCCVLASQGDEEYRALTEGDSYQRRVDLDNRGLFPRTLAT